VDWLQIAQAVYLISALGTAFHILIYEKNENRSFGVYAFAIFVPAINTWLCCCFIVAMFFEILIFLIRRR
jgi:hypothetical protein